MDRIYQTLYLKWLMEECAKLESCKELLTILKTQKPLASNYYCFKFAGPRKIQGNTVIRKVHLQFDGFSTDSCFSNKKVFYKSNIKFAKHIKVINLKRECELKLSEPQDLIVKKLEQLRDEEIEKLSIQLEIKRNL